MNRYQTAREVIKEYAEENELYIYDVVNLKFYESLNQQQAEPCKTCGGDGAWFEADLQDIQKTVLCPDCKQQAEDECACDPEWHEMCQPCRDDEEDI